MAKYGTGKRGPQGPTGPTGASTGSTIFFNQTVPVAISSPLTLTVFASASATGFISYQGILNVYVGATAIDITVTPVIAGSAQSSRAITHTAAAVVVGGMTKTCVPLSGFIGVTAGQSFALQIVLNSYANTPTVQFLSINYRIQ